MFTHFECYVVFVRLWVIFYWFPRSFPVFTCMWFFGGSKLAVQSYVESLSQPIKATVNCKISVNRPWTVCVWSYDHERGCFPWNIFLNSITGIVLNSFEEYACMIQVITMGTRKHMVIAVESASHSHPPDNLAGVWRINRFWWQKSQNVLIGSGTRPLNSIKCFLISWLTTMSHHDLSAEN
jgi:hypothetical protein